MIITGILPFLKTDSYFGAVLNSLQKPATGTQSSHIRPVPAHKQRSVNTLHHSGGSRPALKALSKTTGITSKRVKE